MSSTEPSIPHAGPTLGEPAVTMRGFLEDDLREVAGIIAGALAEGADTAALGERSRVLCERYPLYPGFRGFPSYGQ